MVTCRVYLLLLIVSLLHIAYYVKISTAEDQEERLACPCWLALGQVEQSGQKKTNQTNPKQWDMLNHENFKVPSKGKSREEKTATQDL